MSVDLKVMNRRWREALIKLANKFDIDSAGKKESDLAKKLEQVSLTQFKYRQKIKPKFIILSGASGVGKNEIAKELNKKIIRLPHVTSRLPRSGEKEGREYFFISKNEFAKRIKKGRFLAYRMTYNEYRGVSRDYFLEYLKAKKLFFIERSIPAFLEFKLISLIKKTPYCAVYILPSTFWDLAARIKKRVQKDKSLTQEDINKRLLQAVEHLEIIARKSESGRPFYDLFLINSQAKNPREIISITHDIAKKIIKVVK